MCCATAQFILQYVTQLLYTIYTPVVLDIPICLHKRGRGELYE